jgi:RNA-splicing ligase RtcB
VVRDRISTRLLSWASIPENNTREQAERTASMRFIVPHLAYSAEKIAPNWRLQLGTLGSGYHFTVVSLEQERVTASH